MVSIFVKEGGFKPGLTMAADKDYQMKWFFVLPSPKAQTAGEG